MMKDHHKLIRMENFPPEVMMEILSWIPLKYLLRFRCVNKTWLQLLTNDHIFAKLHLDRCSHYEPSILAVRRERCRCNQIKAPNILARLAQRKEIDPSCPGKAVFYFAEECTVCDKGLDLPLPFDQTHNNCNVYGICNGLVLFWSSDHIYQVYLWNPFMKNYITIQSPPIPAGFYWEMESINGTFGFGFNEATNQYKVIRFFDESNHLLQEFNVDYQLRVSVYTLGIDSSWRTLEETIPYHVTSKPYLAPLVSGALHWLMYKTGYANLEFIVSFDMKDEVFREMSVPADVSLLDWGKIGELGGLLCFYTCRHFRNVRIWVMKEYGAVESWEKQFEITNVIVRYWVPLGFAKNGEIILEKIFSDQLMLYNRKANLISFCERFKFEFDQVYTYVGSLISPTAISRVRAT
ncbi:F-box protein [Thalictrum thalictroides]|uniref:F-box protein n=1 Tax=Thalictrum thalictroides TaxID=46969 RepID=A0A7J6VBE5_THATH|nr:F-box protein [Thalictrum thalictroides]